MTGCRRRLPAVALATFALAAALVLGASCGGADGGDPPPTPAPSAEADALFQQALSAMTGTRSLRYETNIFSAGKLVETRLDEQVAPDRMHRARELYLPERKTEGLIIIGITGSALQESGKWSKPIDLEGDPVAYPGSFVEAYRSSSGFGIEREDTFEGRPATVIRSYHPDDEDNPEDDIALFVEDLVWIDKESGRILKWDVNKFQSEGGKVKNYQQWESGAWEFDADLTIEFPASAYATPTVPTPTP